MASSFRIGLIRLIPTPVGFRAHNISFVRNISSKTLRAKNPPQVQKPAPWPYTEKTFSVLNHFFDKTTARFDENTKVIVVEGPVAAGKSKLAKALAEELDMFYFPEANLDMININDRGFDLRQLNDQMPESCRIFDVDHFLTNPKHFLAASFQFQQYIVKYSQYIDALAHVLSTGQGVVLDRCVYSDFVFLEAMFSQGYLSKRAKNAYYELRDNCIGELLRPHLVIYLDIPVSKVQENIKKRAVPYEKNSPVLTPKYLRVMENVYKQQYLKEMSKYAELLVYDWSEEGEFEIVVEDIERIEFKGPDPTTLKFKDWDETFEEDWAILRRKYAVKKDYLMTYINIPFFDVPELVIDGEDVWARNQILYNTPGERYLKGYDPTMGDKGYLFKLGLPVRNTLPHRERRAPS